MFMKQKILLAVLSLLCATFAKAATIDVKTNLWTGIQEVTDAWGGSQAIAADKLSQVAAGDEIAITVTAISQTADYPQISLRKTEGWAQFEPPVGVLLSQDNVLPYEARITLTEDVAAELKANGCVITGCGFTMESIDLVQKKELGEGEKGNPVHNVWTGNKKIDWSAGVTDG